MKIVAKSAQERAFGVYNLIWDPDMLYADRLWKIIMYIFCSAKHAATAVRLLIHFPLFYIGEKFGLSYYAKNKDCDYSRIRC